jgi:hypothetical protein
MKIFQDQMNKYHSNVNYLQVNVKCLCNQFLMVFIYLINKLPIKLKWSNKLSRVVMEMLEYKNNIGMLTNHIKY